MTTTVLVGNPRRGSRTRAAAEELVRRVTGRTADRTIDLAELGPRLLAPEDLLVADAVAAVRASELLMVASPTYKATYTGLLKLFLERFAAGELAGTTALALMLGGDLRHALAVEVHLRPLLVELGLRVPLPGLFLVDREGLEAEQVGPWLERAALELGVAA